jgi:hypothetical protein
MEGQAHCRIRRRGWCNRRKPERAGFDDLPIASAGRPPGGGGPGHFDVKPLISAYPGTIRVTDSGYSLNSLTTRGGLGR